MKFAFDLRNAAGTNTPKAQIRECTRLASIAWCLEDQEEFWNVQARIIAAPSIFMKSERWKFFRHLYDPDWKVADTSVVPAEVARLSDKQHDVGIKTSVACHFDELYLKRFRLLVAHEYDERFYGERNLLPVPFFVHDRVIETFIRYNVFEEYLRNEVRTIRYTFARRNIRKQKRLCGWCGATTYEGRRTILAKAASWLLVEPYESTHKMAADDHIRWLGDLKGALALPGDTPKTNLPPLLALMGIPIVMWPIDRFDTPPIDSSNAIMVENWEQVRLALRSQETRSRVSLKATRDYKESWSPAGQARLIVERLKQCRQR